MAGKTGPTVPTLDLTAYLIDVVLLLEILQPSCHSETRRVHAPAATVVGQLMTVFLVWGLSLLEGILSLYYPLLAVLYRPSPLATYRNAAGVCGGVFASAIDVCTPATCSR